MKKALKWIGIIFGIFIVIGIIFSEDDKPSESANSEAPSKNSDSTKEVTNVVEANEEEANEEETIVDAEEQNAEAVSNSTYVEYAKYHIPLVSEETLELTKESYDFIVSKHTLFPANADQDIQNVKNMVDNSITFKHLNKNATPYFNKILSFSGSVISIEETPIEGTSDTVALVHVMDDDGNSYQVLLYKTTGDILEEDYVQFWGTPVGPSYFENVSGGTTNVQVFMGSHIEKI